MNYSKTTKYNLYHSLLEAKSWENDPSMDFVLLWEVLGDEYDLDYLISLVKKDLNIE